MTKTLKRIAVTGGAGQIAYSLLFRIAAGELLGRDQPIALHILELPEAMKMLEGVKMELDDCAFPLLKEIHIGSDPKEIFKGVHYALLVGAKPRGPGMERGDINVKILVVGNPCNTNCLIALSKASRLKPQNFFSMMRLDQNRATAQLAEKANVDINAVENVTVWGNHSSTQMPDFSNATINGKPATETITDKSWLEGDFITTVQKRGAAIIAARGKSSAASAASAAIDSMKSLISPTPVGRWFSCAIPSKGNPYGIDENLKDLPIDEFLGNKIKISETELIEERELVKEMLKKS